MSIEFGPISIGTGNPTGETSLPINEVQPIVPDGDKFMMDNNILPNGEPLDHFAEQRFNLELAQQARMKVSDAKKGEPNRQASGKDNIAFRTIRSRTVYKGGSR